jgi:hypothetical protein
MDKNILSEEQIKSFSEKGFLLLLDFYPKHLIEEIQLGIYEIIGQVIKRHGVVDIRPNFSPNLFDAEFNKLITLDRGIGAEIYDAIKQVPAFIRLLADPAHAQIMKQLRPKSIPGVVSGGYGIRIDNPHEDQYRAYWHQEYPAQLKSLNGLVYWSSLVPINLELGPVEFCEGSHKEGPLPVLIDKGLDGARKGAYSLKLYNEQDLLDKYLKVAPISSVGDLVVIDFLVLHASGRNISQRSRWSMQFRYFDFNEPVGISHGWKGSFAAGIDFSKVHPELCVRKSDG